MSLTEDLRIKVISDCHIGLPGAAENDFHFSDEEFIQFLDYSRHSYDCVVLNGDLWELWESGTSKNQLERFNEVAAAHAPLFNYIRDHMAPPDIKSFTRHRNLFYVVGNHDSAAAKYNNLLFGGRVHSQVNLELPGGARIRISHGHECDPVNFGRWAWVGRSITWCVGMLERVVHRDADKHLEKRLAEDCLSTSARTAFDFSRADIIVNGHTHKPGVLRDGYKMRVYANSGCARGPTFIDDVVLHFNWRTHEITVISREYNVADKTFTVRSSETVQAKIF